MIIQVRNDADVRKKNLPLSEGKSYVVYALYKTDDNEYDKVCILDETGAIYPNCYSIKDFDVLDSRLSRFWVTKGDVTSFSEWVEDEFFHGCLFEGDHQALSIFEKYKKDMELEFSIDEVNKYVISLEDNWVQCCECGEAWDQERANELIVCPSCKILLNLPRTL